MSQLPAEGLAGRRPRLQIARQGDRGRDPDKGIDPRQVPLAGFGRTGVWARVAVDAGDQRGTVLGPRRTMKCVGFLHMRSAQRSCWNAPQAARRRRRYTPTRQRQEGTSRAARSRARRDTKKVAISRPAGNPLTLSDDDGGQARG